MELLFVSFFAGMLTVLAPCILPLLPVIIGGSLSVDTDKKESRQWLHPLIITISLACSILVFSLLLKASTALLGVPQEVWQIISGSIVLVFGLHLLFPQVWEALMIKTGWVNRANANLGASLQRQGYSKDILIGASLGPVFSSCSPTYALIVATVLPVSFIEGTVYLLAYVVGLSLVLFLIALFGTDITRRLGTISNPHGLFMRAIGLIFVIVGITVLMGWDKDIQSYILDKGWYNPVSELEQKL